jgi:hypothetical protein
MSAHRPTASSVALIAPPVLIAVILMWGAAQLPFSDTEAAGTPAAAAAPAAATGGFIDHSVLDDADLLPAEDPAPLAVGAYGP